MAAWWQQDRTAPADRERVRLAGSDIQDRMGSTPTTAAVAMATGGDGPNVPTNRGLRVSSTIHAELGTRAFRNGAGRGCAPLAWHSKRSAVRARLAPLKVPGQGTPHGPAGGVSRSFDRHLTVDMGVCLCHLASWTGSTWHAGRAYPGRRLNKLTARAGEAAGRRAQRARVAGSPVGGHGHP
jgi:hypothetical protein